MHTISKLVVAAALVAGTVGIAAAEEAAPDSVKRYEPIYGDYGPATAAWQGAAGGVMYFAPASEPIEEEAPNS